MAEHRRENALWFQQRGRRHIAFELASAPRVSYRDARELKEAVGRAAQHLWPQAVSRTVEVHTPWQECRGTVLVENPRGHFKEFRFGPVPSRQVPEQAQARQTGVRR